MRRTPRAAGNTIVAAFLAFVPGHAAGQPLAISHDGLECWPSDRYPVLSGALSPPDDVRSVRIYFRSEAYPDFYFVDANVQQDGHLEAVLPLAAPDTQRVVYYIEAVTRAFETARTQEWDPEVSESEDCRRRDPMLALFQGKIPTIVVSAVRAGASAFPPGFMAAGIVAAGAGGGIGATAVVAIVSGGVVGGVVVASGGSDETSPATTSVVASPPMTSIPAGGTTSVLPSTTTTVHSSPSSPTTTTTAAPSTTSIPGPSTTTTTASTTSVPATTTAPATTTTTTAPVTTTTTSAPTTTTTSAPQGADMSVTISAPSSVSLLSVIRYQVIVRNNGPSAASGARATISFPSSLTLQGAATTTQGSCSSALGSVQCTLGALPPGGAVTIQMTVIPLLIGNVTTNASVSANESDPVPGNNAASATTRVTLLLRESSDSFVRLSVHLDVPPSDGGDGGDVVVDSRLASVDDTAPVELSMKSEPGEYLVEAVLNRSTGRKGRWRFEFRVSPAIEVSGIQVEAGDVISLEPQAVSFHSRGDAGERLRFRYRLNTR